MNTFQLHILAADCPLYIGPCESLTVPTPQGKYGIWAHHSNMIIAVVPGALFYRLPERDVQVVAVSSGLVKVEHNKVMVLVHSAERAEDIDANRARRAADAAREAMLRNKSIQEYRSAQARLARAMSRLRVKDNYGITRGKRK